MGAPNNSTKLFGPQQAFCSRVKSCCFVLAQRAHCGSQDKGLAKQNSVLITMGCGEACPLVPGLEREDWPLSDPEGRSRESCARFAMKPSFECRICLRALGSRCAS